jgi:hypothetical protein
MAESWNVGRTGADFQCRITTINGLFCNGLQWQQMAAEPLMERASEKLDSPQTKRPARGRPFVIPFFRFSEAQYFAMTGPPQR